ncbi:MAG: molybdopterin molybdotransferase MoeA [Halarcobacter sp.]
MKQLTYLDYKSAVNIGLEAANVIKRTEFINIENAIGRVFSQDIICKKNLPSFDNSAMDGFAFKASDAGKKLKVKRVVFAGEGDVGVVEDGECVKIMTGAKVPNGADTIVPIEDTVSFDEEYVEFPNDIKKGNHFRPKGEEKKDGEIIFNKGDRINSSMVAILAAQGITMIEVFSKPSIAVLSTGNELKEPWESANEDQIYNSNSYAIISMLKEHYFDATYVGVVPDSLEKSIEFIANLKSYDLVITTGGISMGDADFIAQAFIENGLEVEFHGVKVKPGRPTMMGKMDKTFVMAMPGNPLTALVNTYLLALPIIYKISGSSEFYHDFIYAKNVKEYKVRPKRANVVLGNLINGEFNVTRNNKYGSGMLMPIIESNCAMITLDDKDFVKEGEIIKVIPFGLKLKSFKSDVYN